MIRTFRLIAAAGLICISLVFAGTATVFMFTGECFALLGARIVGGKKESDSLASDLKKIREES